MSIHHNSHHMHHFLQNKEMNEMYISHGIFNFALGLISVFIPIYFYKLGYSISMILFFFLLNSLAFVLFSYAGVRVVSKIGVKHSMLLASATSIIFFIGMRFIDFYPMLFFALPVLRAFNMILYNYSFHLNFFRHSDKKDRGKEVSMIQASATSASMLSPFLGGLILKFTSFPVLFIIGSLLILAAMIPLFLSKDSYETLSFDKKELFAGIFKRKNLSLVASFSGYAIESWIGFIVWPIFLYITLFNFESVGAVTSLAAFLTFVIFYFMGKATDKRDKRELLFVGTFLYFFGWLGRVFVTGFGSAFVIDSYKSITQQILFIPWSAYSYDLAAQRNYFKFIVRREVVFNLARIVAFPALIIIFYINFHPFVISFSIAALASLFYMTLGRKAA
ncbi:MAG TPA: hypothetical protein DIC35_05380 [Candidatus Moranbacteria bacterium]|nr:hypothetical protein [Candidatus Moranbacteria bacterium]